MNNTIMAFSPGFTKIFLAKNEFRIGNSVGF